MKYSEIKDLSALELKKKKMELENDYFFSKMKNKMGQLGSSIELRKMRKDIARLSTALTNQKNS